MRNLTLVLVWGFGVLFLLLACKIYHPPTPLSIDSAFYHGLGFFSFGDGRAEFQQRRRVRRGRRERLACRPEVGVSLGAPVAAWGPQRPGGGGQGEGWHYSDGTGQVVQAEAQVKPSHFLLG